MRNWWGHKCRLHYERDVHHLVNCPFITSRRRWLHTHCKCEWDSQHFSGLQKALPRLPEDFAFVFWLRGLIETVRSFQIHIVYVLVLLCMRPCLGWGEIFLYFPSGLATGSPEYLHGSLSPMGVKTERHSMKCTVRGSRSFSIRRHSFFGRWCLNLSGKETTKI